MKQSVPWILAATALIAFLISFQELQRVRGKLGELSKTADWQRQLISSKLRAVSSPIVIFGDSITARSNLPESLCDHPVVNAGIGGAHTFQLNDYAKEVVGEFKPWISVIAVGLNDARVNNQQFSQDYDSLLNSFHGPLILVSITSARDVETASFNRIIEKAAQYRSAPYVDVSNVKYGPDGVHPTAGGIDEWVSSVATAIMGSCLKLSTMR